jgi:hypothetical protein
VIRAPSLHALFDDCEMLVYVFHVHEILTYHRMGS